MRKLLLFSKYHIILLIYKLACTIHKKISKNRIPICVTITLHEFYVITSVYNIIVTFDRFTSTPYHNFSVFCDY